VRKLIDLAAFLFECRHADPSTPRCGRQVCFGCGASRRYRNFGDTPGPWTKRVVELQSSRTIAGKVEARI
jgi:hypothetical protein